MSNRRSRSLGSHWSSIARGVSNGEWGVGSGEWGKQWRKGGQEHVFGQGFFKMDGQTVKKCSRPRTLLTAHGVCLLRYYRGTLDVQAGEPAGAEGGLEVVAADGAV